MIPGNKADEEIVLEMVTFSSSASKEKLDQIPGTAAGYLF